MGGHAVSTALALGINGIRLDVGDHICGLYYGESQRDQILVPFLEAGLASGDKCICVVDGVAPGEVVARLDASTFAADKQLEVIRSSDMYLRSGRFSADEVVGAWKAAMSDVMYDGRFDVVRAVETWSRRDVVPDMQELRTLESEITRYLPLYPQAIMCLYDIERFGAGIIVDLVRTHPRLLVGGTLVENPYYLAPDELQPVSAQATGVTANPEILEAAEWYYNVTSGST